MTFGWFQGEKCINLTFIQAYQSSASVLKEKESGIVYCLSTMAYQCYIEMVSDTILGKDNKNKCYCYCRCTFGDWITSQQEGLRKCGSVNNKKGMNHTKTHWNILTQTGREPLSVSVHLNLYTTVCHVQSWVQHLICVIKNSFYPWLLSLLQNK